MFSIIRRKKDLVSVQLIILLFILSLPQFVCAGSVSEHIREGLGWAYADKNEFLALPEYCRAKFSGPPSPLYEKWHRRIGPDFIHIHHYCRGLTLLRRGKMEFNKGKRKNILNMAIGEMNYTIGHSSNQLNKKFRAMMHEHRAQAYELMGNNLEALKERQRIKLLLKGKK